MEIRVKKILNPAFHPSKSRANLDMGVLYGQFDMALVRKPRQLRRVKIIVPKLESIVIKAQAGLTQRHFKETAFIFARQAMAFVLALALFGYSGGLEVGKALAGSTPPPSGTTPIGFSDTEETGDSALSAGSLDINLSPSGDYASGLMYPGDATTTAFTLSNAGTLAYNYTSKIEPLGGDTQACDYISVSASDGTSTYSSLIKDFVTPTTTPASNVDWDFDFTIATNAPPGVWGKTCSFKWVYTAWQANFSDSASGFNDIAEKSGSIQIGKAVVLNEFLPNPIGADDAAMPGGEWVELYNNSNILIDMAGWVIYDNDDAHELYIIGANTDTGGTSIAPHGYLVVYRNGDSDFNLNNNGDSVRLLTGYPAVTSTLVDAHTYTVEKPEGFSYARIPDGTGDWVDPIPTPGKPNAVDQSGVIPELCGTAVSEAAAICVAGPSKPDAQNQDQVQGAGAAGEGLAQNGSNGGTLSVPDDHAERGGNEPLALDSASGASTSPVEILDPNLSVSEAASSSQPTVQPTAEPVGESLNDADKTDKTDGANITDQQPALLPNPDQAPATEPPVSVAPTEPDINLPADLLPVIDQIITPVSIEPPAPALEPPPAE